MTTPIPTGDLEKYLWGAAVLLRGQIDASGYKEFIFPLLFFKAFATSMTRSFRRISRRRGVMPSSPPRRITLSASPKERIGVTCVRLPRPSVRS